MKMNLTKLYWLHLTVATLRGKKKKRKEKVKKEVVLIWSNSSWAWKESELKWVREVPQRQDVFCTLTW